MIIYKGLFNDFSDFYLEKKEERTELARLLREYVSDLCRLINTSHKIYKFRNEEEIKFSPTIVKSPYKKKASSPLRRHKKPSSRSPLQHHPHRQRNRLREHQQAPRLHLPHSHDLVHAKMPQQHLPLQTQPSPPNLLQIRLKPNSPQLPHQNKHFLRFGRILQKPRPRLELRQRNPRPVPLVLQRFPQNGKNGQKGKNQNS